MGDIIANFGYTVQALLNYMFFQSFDF